MFCYNNIEMDFWERLFRKLGLRRSGETMRFEQTLMDGLADLALQERRPRDELAADLLSNAILQRRTAETNLLRWHALSTREREVAALICLGYSNTEIAARLSIAIPTVKTHVRNTLHKFGLLHRSELRLVLSEWDFSAWT